MKKAVNWAFRQIGKRNVVLNKEAIQVAKEIRRLESRGTKWIASDALRELTSGKGETEEENEEEIIFFVCGYSVYCLYQSNLFFQLRGDRPCTISWYSR